MSKRMYEFGIIGCGVIAPFHARAVADLPNTRLVAVADARPERAREMASAFGVESASATSTNCWPARMWTSSAYVSQGACTHRSGSESRSPALLALADPRAIAALDTLEAVSTNCIL